MNALTSLLPACLVLATALAGCRGEEPAPAPDPSAPAAEAVAAPAGNGPAPSPEPVSPAVVPAETTHEETEQVEPEMPPGTEATPDPEP